jgi:hypothetical protein
MGERKAAIPSERMYLLGPYASFLVGGVLSLLAHVFVARASFRHFSFVRNACLSSLALLLLSLLLARLTGRIDVNSNEYRVNPPRWVRAAMSLGAVVVGFLVGYGLIYLVYVP